jgi:hypothetical protein
MLTQRNYISPKTKKKGGCFTSAIRLFNFERPGEESSYSTSNPREETFENRFPNRRLLGFAFRNSTAKNAGWVEWNETRQCPESAQPNLQILIVLNADT